MVDTSFVRFSTEPTLVYNLVVVGSSLSMVVVSTVVEVVGFSVVVRSILVVGFPVVVRSILVVGFPVVIRSILVVGFPVVGLYVAVVVFTNVTGDSVDVVVATDVVFCTSYGAVLLELVVVLVVVVV